MLQFRRKVGMHNAAHHSLDWHLYKKGWWPNLTVKQNSIKMQTAELSQGIYKGPHLFLYFYLPRTFM